MEVNLCIFIEKVIYTILYLPKPLIKAHDCTAKLLCIYCLYIYIDGRSNLWFLQILPRCLNCDWKPICRIKKDKISYINHIKDILFYIYSRAKVCSRLTSKSIVCVLYLWSLRIWYILLILIKIMVGIMSNDQVWYALKFVT